MNVLDFINSIQENKIVNSKLNPTAVEDYIRKTLDVRDYVPFSEKQQIINAIVQKNIKEVDGVKVIDSTSQYISFIVAMLVSHTNLTISENPIDDYDMLSESGLLETIMTLFEKDYSEFNTLLKMAVSQELESNNLNAIVARFLNNILNKIDGLGEVVKGVIGDVNLSNILGGKINEEDLSKVLSFVDKIK